MKTNDTGIIEMIEQMIELDRQMLETRDFMLSVFKNNENHENNEVR